MFHPQHTTKRKKAKYGSSEVGRAVYTVLSFGDYHQIWILDLVTHQLPVVTHRSWHCICHVSMSDLERSLFIIIWLNGIFQIEWNSPILVVTKILALICTYSQLVWMYSLVCTNWNGIVVPIQRVTQKWRCHSALQNTFSRTRLLCATPDTIEIGGMSIQITSQSDSANFPPI